MDGTAGQKSRQVFGCVAASGKERVGPEIVVPRRGSRRGPLLRLDRRPGKERGRRELAAKIHAPRQAEHWSKINREKVQALIESGEMQPAGLAEIERAKNDGRWDAAYDSPSSITVPDDLKAELDKNKRARSFFETLDSRNRYAILFRIHTAKRAETRTKRIREFVAMLERKEKLYP